MNKVKIRVNCNSYKFINFLINNCIYYESLECFDSSFILIVTYDNYKKISRWYETSIIKYYGKNGFINYISFNKYMLLSFIISLFVLFLLSNTIFDIRINSDNKELIKIIKKELYDNGIYKYKSKKSFEKISVIKKKILESNKNNLEWIEIKSKGCTYTVELTPRVINNKQSSIIESSSIYSTSNGVVKHINVESGTRKVDIEDYVHKGDLLISGNILKDNTLINSVNAKGKVYAEVWYLVNTSIPFKYNEYISTGKIIKHYYLDIFGYKFTISGKYDSNNTINKKYKLIDKPYLFKLYLETKEIYKNKEYNLSTKEAYSKALKLSEDKIKSNLNSDEYIISKKVLKKEVKSSKMEIEVFFKIYKNIGYTSNIEKIGEIDGESIKRGNR